MKPGLKRGLKIAAALLLVIVGVPAAAIGSAFIGTSAIVDGVELEGVDDGPFTAAQYAVLAALQEGLQARYPLRFIQGHSDIAPGRKTDPGTGFDWSQAGRGLTREIA